MALLVTGGAGFIGSALVRYLIRNTTHTVINVDKLTYAGNVQALRAVHQHPRYVFYRANICDAAQLQRIIARHKPRAVFHLAAESHVDRSIAGPEPFIQSNIVGTFTLLETLRDYWLTLSAQEQLEFRLIHVSTDEVYGDLGLNERPPIAEGAPYWPSSPYSASKASSDHLVQAWYRTYGLPSIVTHCVNNYGPFQYPEKLIPFMIRQALQDHPLTIYGQGEPIRDWLNDSDHVRALNLILRRGRVGQNYHISAHEQLSNLELVHRICAYLDELCGAELCALLRERGRRRFADLIVHVADRPGHDQRYALDASKLRQELGWQPEISLSTGLKDTVRWYVDYFQQQAQTHKKTPQS